MTCGSTETQSIVKDVLKAVGAWRTGHFLLSSGLHSDQYVQCQRLMQYPRLGSFLADLLAKELVEHGFHPDAVVGPALGAVHWELFVAGAVERLKLHDRASKTNGSGEYHLNCDTVLDAITEANQKKMIKAIFAERPDGSQDFSIRRGIELEKGAKVVVVEDVTTTGGSARKVVELIKSMGCEPIAVGAIADRSGGKASFDVPFLSLVKLELQTYDPSDCPLCKSGSKAEKPGTTPS